MCTKFFEEVRRDLGKIPVRGVEVYIASLGMISKSSASWVSNTKRHFGKYFSFHNSSENVSDCVQKSRGAWTYCFVFAFRNNSPTVTARAHSTQTLTMCSDTVLSARVQDSCLVAVQTLWYFKYEWNGKSHKRRTQGRAKCTGGGRRCLGGRVVQE